MLHSASGNTYRGTLPNGSKHFGLADLACRIRSGFKVPERSSSLGMDNPLGDAFPMELGEMV